MNLTITNTRTKLVRQLKMYIENTLLNKLIKCLNSTVTVNIEYK